jgi:hypothetical protein
MEIEELDSQCEENKEDENDEEQEYSGSILMSDF